MVPNTKIIVLVENRTSNLQPCNFTDSAIPLSTQEDAKIKENEERNKDRK
jgi:hypothetical protein